MGLLYLAGTTLHTLPLAGGLLDQPVSLLEGLMGVHVALRQEEQKEIEKLKRKMKRR